MDQRPMTITIDSRTSHGNIELLSTTFGDGLLMVQANEDTIIIGFAALKELVAVFGELAADCGIEL